jgi:hypothetical protein
MRAHCNLFKSVIYCCSRRSNLGVCVVELLVIMALQLVNPNADDWSDTNMHDCNDRCELIASKPC